MSISIVIADSDNDEFCNDFLQKYEFSFNRKIMILNFLSNQEVTLK